MRLHYCIECKRTWIHCDCEGSDSGPSHCPPCANITYQSDWKYRDPFIEWATKLAVQEKE